MQEPVVTPGPGPEEQKERTWSSYFGFGGSRKNRKARKSRSRSRYFGVGGSNEEMKQTVPVGMTQQEQYDDAVTTYKSFLGKPELNDTEGRLKDSAYATAIDIGQNQLKKDISTILTDLGVPPAKGGYRRNRKTRGRKARKSRGRKSRSQKSRRG